MFIIRACSRQVSNYVLSFTSNRKIVHAQIVRVSRHSYLLFANCCNARMPTKTVSDTCTVISYHEGIA